MSAATLAHPAPVLSRSHARPGLARLTAVELRKMTDARAGFWLQLAVAALTIVVVGAACLFARPEDQTLRSMLAIAVAPASILLPIVGILLVTSEWSQRTGMVTFALVPRRGRVIVAKLLASVVLSLVALGLCLVAAVVGAAVAAPGLDHTWALPVGLLGQHVVSLGTGSLERPIPYNDAKDWGLVHWARPILNVLMDGNADTTCYQLDQVLGESHYRFDISLGENTPRQIFSFAFRVSH